MREHKYRYSKGGMTSVKSDDGEDLKFKIDTDEMSIEVDETTKNYLSDIALIADRQFRKLKDTYIFWYDDLSDNDVVELQDVFQTSLTKFAKGGKVKKKRVKFVDKVESIADRLDGTKVPKRLKKDYGARYNRTEAEEAARRIAGAQLRDRKMAEGGETSEDLFNLFNYVRLYYKARLDSDTAASNGNLAHSIRLDDKADDYRNHAMRLIDDYNKKNNTNLSIYDFNRDGILKLHIEQIEEYFDLEYIGEYGNKMRFINKNDGSILEINISSNPKDDIMKYYQENYKDGGEMAKGGNVDDDDTFVMLFKGYGFVEKRGSYGTRTFYNKKHNAYIYYDPKFNNIYGYVGGGEGNDEVIPYSVEGVFDFFIKHDITESEATPMADGGKVLDLKDVYNDLRSKVGRLQISEESEDYINCDIRDWGNWEHDYEDYERDEEDFEDDDSMILSESSAKNMQGIVEEIRSKYPNASIYWNTSEKNYIDFQIRRKMADGGKVKEEEYKKLYRRLKQKKEKGETLDKREEYALNKSEYILKTRGKMADGGYVNQYFGKGFENDAITELKKALPNHKFEKGKNKIIVDGGKFIISLDEGRYGFIREYNKEGSLGGHSVQKLDEAIDFIETNKMAKGGNVWDEDLNVYTLVSSKEYFGSDTASDKRRWFRRNGRGLSRDQAKRMAEGYIDRYGKDRVYIGNIRHYR